MKRVAYKKEWLIRKSGFSETVAYKRGWLIRKGDLLKRVAF